MVRQRSRPKASDIFRQTNFDFGKKASFEEAYPEIDDIQVKVTETGQGVSRYFKGPSVYTQKIGLVHL